MRAGILSAPTDPTDTEGLLAPLITLMVVTAALLVAGAAGVRVLRPWPVAVRGGLAAMFTLTGIVHFPGPRGPGKRLRSVGRRALRSPTGRSCVPGRVSVGLSGVADCVWIWLGVPLAVLFAAILLQRLEAALLTGPEADESPSEVAPLTLMPPALDPPPPRQSAAPPAPSRASA